MHILSTYAPVVDAALCEPSDDAFVADLLGLDDEVDEGDDDEHETSDEVDDQEVETTSHEVDAQETNETSDEVDPKLERQQVETRILGSTCSIEELIAQEVNSFAARIEAEVIDVDLARVNIDGISTVESLRGQVLTLRLRLESAVVCPWQVRPAHRETKLRAWQRLRVLEAVAGLRTCGRCAGYGREHSPNCQAEQLRTLSMQLGDLEFWLDQPRRHSRDAVGAHWPAKMKPALWKRWRERLAVGVGFISGGPLAQATEEPQPPPTPDESGCLPLGVAQSAPTNEPNTSDSDAICDSHRTSLPVALLDRRAELGDGALYILSLLALPKHKDIDADGWRPLKYAYLEQTLGVSRVKAPGQTTGKGKLTARVAVLLGAPERPNRPECPNRPARPGLLESLGLIERRAGYLAGKDGWSQRYRLADQSLRSGPRETIELVLRERKGASLPTRERCEGPAVHPHLSACHPRLRLGYFEALADLCARAGIEYTGDPAAISTAIGELPPREPARTKAGKIAKEQPPDPRVGWQAELAALDAWALPDSAKRHQLRRDANVTRLHSPLTTLKRPARQFLTINGRPAVVLDLRAAGLVLQAGQMRRTGATADPDCAAWVEMVEREDAYEALFELRHGRKPGNADEREAIKGACRAFLYGSIADQCRSALGKAVKSRYPGFFAWLLEQKREHGHRELACQAQRLEAAIVLEALPPVMEATGITVAPIHDAIVVADVDADRARGLYEEALRAAGVRGVVR